MNRTNLRNPYFLFIWLYLLLVLGPDRVNAANKSPSIDRERQTTSKLAQASNLGEESRLVVQQQIYLINRIEKALAQSTDLHRVKALKGQLFLHQGRVERLLKSQYPNPASVCEPSSNSNSSSEVSSNLSQAQKQVYCALYSSLDYLGSLEIILERRLPRLADLTGTNPLSLEPSEPINFSRPAPSKLRPIPNIPLAEPPIIGKPAKRAIANYTQPLNPAIATPEQAPAILERLKQLTAQATAAFPTSISFINPAEDSQFIERNTYNVYPRESTLYSQFLAQPNTGITLIFPDEVYRANPQQVQNRLAPTIAERYPFAPLTSGSDNFISRLAVQVKNQNFQLVQPGLDYGFIADLGDIAIEEVAKKLSNTETVLPPVLDIFLTYSPPNKLKAFQEERQRLITGKLGNYQINRRGMTQSPAIINHTYLVRLIQFKLPSVLLTDEPIFGSQRGRLDEILKTSSSDLLVAFRPVSRRRDGSYTVLWQVLGKFSDPEITDLERYVNLR